MGNLIHFPLKNEPDLRNTLAVARKNYLKAGLSDQEADAAIKELEPLLSPLLGSYESVFELSENVGLTHEQTELIKEAHNKCIQDLFAHFGSKIGYAACTIAGLIGRNYAPDS